MTPLEKQLQAELTKLREEVEHLNKQLAIMSRGDRVTASEVVAANNFALTQKQYAEDLQSQLTQAQEALAVITKERDRLRDVKWEGIVELEKQLVQAQAQIEFVTRGSFDASAVMAKENAHLREQLTQAREELAQEKKWKEEDPRMLREQIHVADEAFNFQKEQLHQSNSLVLELRAFLKDVASNYDCDEGAHGTHRANCRSCNASQLLDKTTPASTNYIPREEYERLKSEVEMLMQPCRDDICAKERNELSDKLTIYKQEFERLVEAVGNAYKDRSADFDDSKLWEAFQHATQLLKGGHSHTHGTFDFNDCEICKAEAKMKGGQ